ncbi:3'-5' exonuclease [Anaerosporobacter faecicola]|uniref:3'-5' exonuclease n=1 Tax=Anaerosporobacter faecicola TaxID=2718714 RepID=UPI001439B1D2|nr:3'-5' exonuclease [Anaerosporobacter faecicola]
MSKEYVPLRDYVAFDIETTGLHPEQDEIIEIGAVRYREGVPVESYTSFIRPKARVSEKITEITGITNDILLGERECTEVLPEFLAFVKDDVVIGHNVRFDHSFIKLQAELQQRTFRNKAIDTLYLAKKLHPDLESRSLAAMCQYYGIINERAHRAKEDAVACAKLYELLLQQFYENAPKVFQARQIVYKRKKIEGITTRQKYYLNDLAKYHKINLEMPIEELSKSEASRLIDKIIFNYGRISYR